MLLEEMSSGVELEEGRESHEGSWEEHKHEHTTLPEEMSSGVEEGRDVQRMKGHQ